MTDHSYPVEVQSDFLEKITRAKPVQALAELIWNALDADASNVSVSFDYNELGALSAIILRDDGLGIPRSDAPEFFRRLGGSWKRPGATTAVGRFLHGQEGRGRFKAFALGRVAEWSVVYERDSKLWSYRIRMSANDIRHVSISDEVAAAPDARSGVTLTVAEPLKDYRTFGTEAGLQELTEVFALYLSDYPNVLVSIDGKKIDPSVAIVSRKSINLADIEIEGRQYATRLDIIEWRGMANRVLFLCNDKRFPLVQVDRRFHIGEFQFSAYLQSPYITAAQNDGTVELAEMQPFVIASIHEAQQAIKDYFRTRAAQEARTYVEEWKIDRIYPFEGDPVTQVEQVNRQVFDIVAVNVARHLPDFSSSQPKNKAFQLRMLKQAIEKSPDELQLILGEVLKLPKRQQEELAELLRDVSLSSIISAAKVVADRLKFLTGLEAVLFDPEPKKRLKERSQLHRIISQNCWLFGEEFNLSVDDQSLTAALRAHKKLLGDEVIIDAPVKHISQSRGILDLMLSKATKRHKANELTHLVVELKAPKVRIDAQEINQIESYAFSVIADERFRNVKTTWVFWVISDDYGDYAINRIIDSDGLIHSKGNVSIYVKTWAQVLDENRARLQFFQDKLEVQADKGSSLKHLQERYAKYLEGVFEEERGERVTSDDETRSA